MKGSRIIEFKRMLRQYEYSLEDLQDVKDLASDINVEFNSAIAALQRPDLFDNKKVEQQAEEADVEEIIPEERDPAFKKLFRKVVVACHPDKFGDDMTELQKATKKDLYDRAIKANDTYSWAELITVAIKLEIDLPEEYYEYVENLKADAEKVQKEIHGIQTSVAWTWYHAPDETKDMILKRYVAHMEKVILGNNKRKVKILGVGHPRTGTGFTASILNAWGLEVGHEVVKKDGLVAWQFAVQDGPWPYMPDQTSHVNWEVLIYNVRDPRTSIPSIVFTEDNKKTSLDYRVNSGGVLRSPNRVEQAIYSILRWDELINKMGPSFTYRIEDQSKDLFNFLQTSGMSIEWQEPAGPVNARSHSNLEELKEELDRVRPSLRMKLNAFCVKHGYDPLY